MGEKKTGWCAGLVLALTFLAPAAARAGDPFWFIHGPALDRSMGYSPMHYCFPQLWRVRACLCGVEGMPVSVYPTLPAEPEEHVVVEESKQVETLETPKPLEKVTSGVEKTVAVKK
jgi:hypothetical protein